MKCVSTWLEVAPIYLAVGAAEQPQSKVSLPPICCAERKGNATDKFSIRFRSPKQGWSPSNIRGRAHLQFKTHINNVAVISHPIKVKTGHFVETWRVFAIGVNIFNCLGVAVMIGCK